MKIQYKKKKEYHSFVIDKIVAEFRREKAYKRAQKRKEDYLEWKRKRDEVF